MRRETAWEKKHRDNTSTHQKSNQTRKTAPLTKNNKNKRTQVATPTWTLVSPWQVPARKRFKEMTNINKEYPQKPRKNWGKASEHAGEAWRTNVAQPVEKSKNISSQTPDSTNTTKKTRLLDHGAKPVDRAASSEACPTQEATEKSTTCNQKNNTNETMIWGTIHSSHQFKFSLDPSENNGERWETATPKPAPWQCMQQLHFRHIHLKQKNKCWTASIIQKRWDTAWDM